MTPWIRLAALASGAFGLVADVLLVLFYLSDRPWSPSPTQGWYGQANDFLIIVQFLALIPVVPAVGRVVARGWTRIAVAAAIGVVVLQILLVTGALPFEIQVVPVSLCTVVTMLWAGVISRSLTGGVRTLGRAILIGVPIALAAFLIGFAVTAVASVDWAWAAGGVPGGVVWFLFPLWTLLLGAASAPDTGPAQAVTGRREGSTIGGAGQ